MSFSVILFYIFAAILLFAAVNVVTAKNPVHAALFLVLAFFTSAFLWMLMQAEFLAIVLVLVYVGAVMVLFLFVIMMLNVDMEAMRKGFWKHLPVAITVGVLIALELVLILVNQKTNLAEFAPLSPVAADYSNVRDLGLQIYTTYLLPFELASVLLLLGIVAAIALTQRKRKNTHHINPADQIKVRRQDRVKVVKVEAEKPEVEVEGSEQGSVETPSS